MKPYSLSSKERIKNKKDFELIYSSGHVVVSADKKFKALFVVDKNTDKPGVKIAAAVSKKLGNAVWRNRVKRLIKESFRLNKELILSSCLSDRFLLKIVFSPSSLNQKKNKSLKLNDVMPGIVDILVRLKGMI